MSPQPLFLSGRRRFITTLAGAAAALTLPSKGTAQHSQTR